MNQLTPTSQDGDHSNDLKGQPGLQRANSIYDGSPANSDECFKCHKLGHWAIHCPSVDVRPQCNAVQGGDPGAYSIPEKHCPSCGVACLIRTSRTEANPGKKFYRCHGRKGGVQCNFFQWCDASVSSPRQNFSRGFRAQSATPTQISPVAAGGGFREQPATPTQISPGGGFRGQSATFPQNSSGGGGFRGQSITSPQNSPGGGGFGTQSATSTQISPLAAGGGFREQPATPTQNSPGGGFRGQSATSPQNSSGGGGFREQSITSPQNSPGGGGFGTQSATSTQISPVAAGGGFREQPAIPTQNSPGGGFRGQSATSPQNSSGGGGFRGQSITSPQNSPGRGGFGTQSATSTQISPVAAGGGFREQPATPTQNSPGGGFRGQSATSPQNSPGGGGWFRWQCASPGNNSNGVGIVGVYDYSTRCPCGAGPCPVLTARTPQNIGRQFVTCPVRKGEGSCGFFKWLDDLDSSNMPLPVTTNDFTPKHEAGSYGRNGASSCYKCGKGGHWKNDCPQLK